MDLLKTVLRLAQPGFGFLAMICVATAFPERQTFGGLTVHLTTHTFNFMLLMNFTSFVAMTAYVVTIYGLRLASEPKTLVRSMVDGLFFLFLFSGAIAAAVSNINQECTLYNINVNCSTIHAAVVFTFFGALAFLGTLGISAMEYQQEAQRSPVSLHHYNDALTPQSVPVIPVSISSTVAGRPHEEDVPNATLVV